MVTTPWAQTDFLAKVIADDIERLEVKRCPNSAPAFAEVGPLCVLFDVAGNIGKPIVQRISLHVGALGHHSVNSNLKQNDPSQVNFRALQRTSPSCVPNRVLLSSSYVRKFRCASVKNVSDFSQP